MHSESQRHRYYLISMIYAYAVQQHEHNWYIQTDKDSHVLKRISKLVLQKFIKNLAVQLACCCHSFMQSEVVIRLVISLMSQNE